MTGVRHIAGRQLAGVRRVIAQLAAVGADQQDDDVDMRPSSAPRGRRIVVPPPNGWENPDADPGDR